MWIPHFGYIFWQRDESTKKSIKKSESDDERRDFEIIFVLENTTLRKIKEAPFVLNKNFSQKQVERKNDKHISEMVIRYERNEDGKLSRIICLIKEVSRSKATEYSYNSIAQILSIKAYEEAAPINIYAIIAIDKKNNASWISKPQSVVLSELSIPEGIALDRTWKSMFSLYREGVISNSPFYRFFCFYKILEGFYLGRGLFNEADKIISKNKSIFPDLKRPKERIDKKMLILSLAFNRYDELQGKTFGQFFEWVRKEHRHLIAHTFPDKYDEERWLNLDDFRTFTEFAIIGNLTDLIIRQIIEDELNLWEKFSEKRLLEPLA